MKPYNSFKYNALNKNNTKKLRREMTEQERKLWYLFLKNYPIRFYRQRRIKKYIVDFYCAEAKIAVELDGSQHYSDNSLEYDKQRTVVLESEDIKVLRFTNPQVTYKFSEVCEAIDNEIKSKLKNN